MFKICVSKSVFIIWHSRVIRIPTEFRCRSAILFLAYTNDLLQYVEYLACLLIRRCHCDLFGHFHWRLHSIIKQDLLSLENWESDWKMETNAAKDNVYNYKLNEHNLESLYSVTYLGLYPKCPTNFTRMNMSVIWE